MTGISEAGEREVTFSLVVFECANCRSLLEKLTLVLGKIKSGFLIDGLREMTFWMTTSLDWWIGGLLCWPHPVVASMTIPSSVIKRRFIHMYIVYGAAILKYAKRCQLPFRTINRVKITW